VADRDPIDIIYDTLGDHDCEPRRTGDRIVARCPAHEDRTPSLSVARGERRDIVLNCFAGCTAQAVMDALDLSWSDLSPQRADKASSIVAEYDYRDETGTLLYQVLRLEPKTFRQRRPVAGGQWQYSTKGVRRVLYRLPELRAAIDAGPTTVYVCEGEKDVERLVTDGHVATCNSGGTGNGFSRELAAMLDGAHEVIVIADNDQAGRNHARNISTELTLGRIRHRIVRSPHGKDVSDLYNDGGTVADLVPLSDDPPDTADILELVPVDSTADPLADSIVDWNTFWTQDHDATQWLIEGIIPASRLMAVYAEAKTGKSWIMLAVCAAAASGRPILDHPGGERVRILYCDLEMTAADLYERLGAHGYSDRDDLSELHYALLPNLPPLDTAEGGAALLASAIARGVQLVVLDTTSRVVQGEENSADTFQDLYRHTLMPLKAAGIAVVRLDHAGKEKERGMRGSSAKRDDADVVVRIEKVPNGIVWKATHRRIGWYPEQITINVTEADGVHRLHIASENVPSGTAVKIDELDKVGVPVDMPLRKLRDQYGIRGANAVIAAAQAHRKRRDRSPVDLVALRPDDGPDLSDFDLGGA
jgi:5S rRNA maturation endonuclease (ribonuclease M5)